MSSITPITFGADLATYGRGADPVYRSPRIQGDPVVQPPAVILPRTAAWLNVSVAPDLTGQDTDGGSQAGSGQAGAGQAGAGAGFAQTGQAPADAAAPPSLVASLNAQSVAASAAGAVASGQAAAQDAQPAGFGSVVQLV